MRVFDRRYEAFRLVHQDVYFLSPLTISPLKRTSSSGFTFVPSSVTILPLTATTPAVIRSSASRREQMPELAMKRFRRISPVGLLGLYLG